MSDGEVVIFAFQSIIVRVFERIHFIMVEHDSIDKHSIRGLVS
jgi:hypothetical protein